MPFLNHTGCSILRRIQQLNYNLPFQMRLCLPSIALPRVASFLLTRGY